MGKSTRMTGRIPCAPETKNLLRDFARGLAMTYDDMLNFMYDKVTKDHEKPLFAGEHLREEAARWKSQQPKGESDGD